MTDNQANSHNNLDEDSIDIIALLKTIWIGKKFIGKVTILFFLIGCIVALLSPIVYTSETTFVPQASEDQSSKSGLGSIASLAGINLNSANGSSESYLSPLLYSKLAESEEFSRDIIEEEIFYLNGNKLTIKEHLQSNNNLFNFNPKTIKERARRGRRTTKTVRTTKAKVRKGKSSSESLALEY